MDRVQSGDATISYTRAGTGPTLVLVHGGFSDHENFWQAVRPALEQRFTVVSIARRGRGESSRSTGHTVDDEGRDVAVVIDAVGGDVFLLGHSYGGWCALAAAVRSARVRKLILYEPPGPDFIATEDLAQMEESAARGDWDKVVELFLGEQIAAAVRPTPFWASLVKNAGPTMAGDRDIATVSGAERFRELDIPVLLLTGSETADRRVATGTLARLLPDCRVVVLEGQGHAAMLTSPALFLEKAEAFLLGE
jgi:pimeloyl-ACP methyl ester carboxylesterase